MSNDLEHLHRMAAIASRFEEAMARLTARLTALSRERAEQPRDDGGWSPAQIAWHVAAVNHSFAAIVDGTVPVSAPAPEGFKERGWEEIGAGMAPRLDAPARVQPPATVTHDEAMSRLAASGDALVTALRGLDSARARRTIVSPIVGTVSLYQVGEWAAVHVARHNRQMKLQLSGA